MVTDSFTLGADGMLRCRVLEQFDWQAHGFGTRQTNPVADVTLRQIHSSLVYNAHTLTDREREGDALVTDATRLSIGVRTADCVPILLLDAKQGAVAAVHAGWRGTAAQILSQTIKQMRADFATRTADVWAAIGPCIRECCYEVGPDVWQQFTSTFPEWERQATTHDGKRNLNLARANIQQLRESGVPPAQIADCGLCTFCRSDLFYSYRRVPQETGRMLSVIMRLSY